MATIAYQYEANNQYGAQQNVDICALEKQKLDDDEKYDLRVSLQR
jgi:hypothetical protein